MVRPVLCSGTENAHEKGVERIIAIIHEKSRTEWKPVSNRITTTRFHSKHITQTVIQCYAPTNDASDYEKALNDTTAKTRNHDMVIMLGDRND